MAKSMPLKSDTILIAGAPPSFDLMRSLQTASSIWMVSAFAHKSGWKMIRDSLLKSSAELTLISGINFCQTEPAVLRDWISNRFRRRGAKSFLYVGNEIFHPKIFIVKKQSKIFALVGSGNLSAGGLRDNIECFAYVKKSSAISEIISWLNDIIGDKNCCIPLTAEYINAYEPRYKKASRARKDIHKRAKEAKQEITAVQRASMKNWRRAVTEAKKFFHSSKFNWYNDQKVAARDILKVLHHPKYDFTREEWSEFYDIWYLGHLIAIYKYRVFRQKAKLRNALRLLSKTKIPIVQRVDAALDSKNKTYVSYLGINAVSKILASIEPKKWPVWNNVAKRVMHQFGYKAPRNASPGQKYAAYAELMRQFMRDTNATDMLALDCFIIWKDRELKG